MKQLDGQAIFVTGAAGGIGTLVCQRLRSAGAHVTGIDRIESSAADASIVADLSDQTALSQLGAQLAGQRVDMLVNIAGFQYFGPMERQAADNIWLGYVINLVAPATLIAAVLPQMQARNAGHIVNLGSVMGSINFPYFAAYSSSKAGLRGLSEALRREVHGRDIAVTYIAPRAVRTAFNNADVNRFMAMTGMAADSPEHVADRIVKAILARKKDVVIGGKESLFIRLNALFPRMVDAGLAGQTAKASTMFLPSG